MMEVTIIKDKKATYAKSILTLLEVDLDSGTSTLTVELYQETKDTPYERVVINLSKCPVCGHKVMVEKKK